MVNDKDVLNILQPDKIATIQEMADELKIEVESIKTIINRLEIYGFVKKRTIEPHYCITNAGKRNLIS